MDKDHKITRRKLLRDTANLTTGLIAVRGMHVAAAEPRPDSFAAAPDHDPETGEIFDRDRHHHWDTV